ncbi:Glucose--fructose oxidoreductase precursor [Poriferisphaera corsica]|uniref:Glucose--fructose oxidoreductase n=1 Tax=Poriferisphaera corsica TaxID=2528020 RepID=A0A517YPT1_9BACT|nr:Gfo/Idh/MocA family oxidoreductase [Poriferisphaera corsica]QDU32220.1 Glucose--fructose oxidoreductase precursor [Poriferisphaera corsica]
MTSKERMKLAIIGTGNIAQQHLKSVEKLNHVELVAVCDVNSEAADKVADEYGVKAFYDHKALIKSNMAEAVLIATPHYFHTDIAIDALRAGLHVLSEKPMAVTKRDCERMLAAHTDQSKVFAVVFNFRTYPALAKAKELLDSGELGEIIRVNVTATDWLRTNAYYESGTWRAKWATEGGGVLVNQCPHHIDLIQWLTGVPTRIFAVCKFGQHHDIEVEDDVVATFEYANGAVGIFTTSTGECPGRNRIEISTQKGLLTINNLTELTLLRNESTCKDVIETGGMWDNPWPWKCEIPVGSFDDLFGRALRLNLSAFAKAVLGEGEPLAVAEEGMKSVEMANAMLYSTLINQAVDLPLDAEAFQARFDLLCEENEPAEAKN